uniref:PPM-type phosphatase domain-containing protein n=1 Tax=Panagrolaimus superbus TaxID=310955 RepID=A0A914YZU3_9BILA
MSSSLILNADAESADNTFDYGFVPAPRNSSDNPIEAEDLIMYKSRECQNGTFQFYALVNGFRNGHVVAEHVGNALVQRIFFNDDIGNLDTSDSDTARHVDKVITSAVKDAFIKTDSDYFNAKIDSVLAERLQQQLVANKEMTYDSFEQLSETEHKIAGGAVAILAMIINKRLYIANCGNSVAFLTKIGKDPDELHAFQASELHESHEIKEIDRLQRAGVDPMNIDGPSRCFGDYFRKTGFHENPSIKTALAEPVCVEPAVAGGLEVDENYCFLLLLSPSLGQAILKIETDRKVSEYIIQLFVNHIREEGSLKGAAQAVLESIHQELQVKIEQGHLRPLETSLSLVVVPLNDDIVELLRESEKSIHAQSHGDNTVDSYVDFSEYFVDTPEMQDKRNDIEAKIASIKQLYKENKKLRPISED